MVGRADGAVSRTQRRRRGDLGLGYPVDQAALGPDMRRRLRSSAKDGREEQSGARGTRPGAAHGPFFAVVLRLSPAVLWLYRRGFLVVVVVANPTDRQQESGALEETIGW